MYDLGYGTGGVAGAMRFVKKERRGREDHR